MSVDFTLTAKLRDDQGKGASRRLRREGKVPAILYGGGRDTRSITLSQRELDYRLQHEAFYTNILTIKVEDEEQACILKDLQRHPAKPMILHVDLQRVMADQKIRMNIPLHFIGEDIAPGIKQEGGTISHLMTDIEITCLPKDLPQFIEIDVSELTIGDAIHLSAIVLPEGVELLTVEGMDQPVASCHHIKVIEEPVEEEEELEAAEGEEAEEAEEAEGEAAEGGAEEPKGEDKSKG